MRSPIVFILGSSGLIGRECVKFFLTKNYIVYGFSKSTNPFENSNNYIHTTLDIIHQSAIFFKILEEQQPGSIIIATGNHGVAESQENAASLFYLHLTFADHLIRELKVLNYESSLIFCSSLMAYVPDRIFPSYAASKAGLNQLILSSIPNVPSKLKISGINLGPVAKNPSHWFETTPLQVTQKIDKLLKAKTCGLIFYPRIGKLLAFLSIVHPFILEKLLIGRRRPHG